MKRRRRMVRGAPFTITGWLRSQATAFWVTVGVIFLITGVAFSYGASFVAEQEAQLTPDPPARVDGVEVTEREVSNRVGRLRDQWRQERPYASPDPVQEVAMRAGAVEQAIDRLVMLGEGRLRGFAPTRSEVDSRWEGEIARFLPPAPADEGLPEVWGGLQARKEALKGLRRYISSLGLTETAYKGILADELLLERMEAALQEEATTAAAAQAEAAADTARELLAAGATVAEAGADMVEFPGVATQPDTWMTRSQAEGAGLIFGLFWEATGWVETSNGPETWFVAVHDRRLPEGPEWEEWRDEQLAGSGDDGEFQLGSVPSEADLAADYEAVLVDILRLSPPLEENLAARRAALRATHEVVVLDAVVLSFQALSEGDNATAAALADEVISSEPGRTDALALCAASRLPDPPAPAPVAAEGEEEPVAEAPDPAAEASLARGVQCALDAASLAPYDPGILVLAGRLLVAAGRHDEAVPHLAEAATYRGDDIFISFTLAGLFREAGREDLALEEEAAQEEIIARLTGSA